MDKWANIYEVFHLADPARGQQVDGYGPNFLWNFLKILPGGHVIWPLSSAQLMVHNKIVEVQNWRKVAMFWMFSNLVDMPTAHMLMDMHEFFCTSPHDYPEKEVLIGLHSQANRKMSSDAFLTTTHFLRKQRKMTKSQDKQTNLSVACFSTSGPCQRPTS